MMTIYFKIATLFTIYCFYLNFVIHLIYICKQNLKEQYADLIRYFPPHLEQF